ncbi:MAG: folate-binding protein [Mariprofundaceae bacterium]
MSLILHDNLGGCTCALRQSLSVIKVSGDRLRDYLQGQVTQDLTRLSAEQSIYGAVLTPQGKIVSPFYMLEAGEDEILVITAREAANDLVHRLRQYAIGYTLRIGIFDALHVISVQGKGGDAAIQTVNLTSIEKRYLACEKQGDVWVVFKPEADSHGYWLVTPTEQVEEVLSGIDTVVDESAFLAACTLHGTPNFTVDWQAGVYALNVNFIEYQGVSFDKGCYVGQELTSRMQWRGGIKWRFYRVQLAMMPNQLPSPIETTAEVGKITSAAQSAEGQIYGIAHLRIAAVEAAQPMYDQHGNNVDILGVCAP